MRGARTSVPNNLNVSVSMHFSPSLKIHRELRPILPYSPCHLPFRQSTHYSSVASLICTPNHLKSRWLNRLWECWCVKVRVTLSPPVIGCVFIDDGLECRLSGVSIHFSFPFSPSEPLTNVQKDSSPSKWLPGRAQPGIGIISSLYLTLT